MNNNTVELLNIILIIQKMIFFLFVIFACMFSIAYVWRVMLIREMRRCYQGVKPNNDKKETSLNKTPIKYE